MDARGGEGLERRLVPVSAIEHWSYCPRQCALIHVEQTFDENLYTIRGRFAHERVDDGGEGSPGDVPVLRSVRLWSDRLGLTGRSDAVELRRDGPYPVEYKVGPPAGRHAAFQLCAQALCLEEMTGRDVQAGAIYHVATRHRVEILFDDELRSGTIAIIASVRTMLETAQVPPPVADGRCRRCSLLDSCQPYALVDIQRRDALDEWLFRTHAEGDG